MFKAAEIWLSHSFWRENYFQFRLTSWGISRLPKMSYLMRKNVQAKFCSNLFENEFLWRKNVN